MSNYQTKGIINRYWKRPKARVYECNIRDAERFYNQSYKDYLDAKESAGRRDAASHITDDSIGKWRVHRSNSLFDSLTDSAYETPSRSSFLNSNSRQYGDESYSGTSTLRASSVTNSSSRASDNDSGCFEDRLQRIQKLRSELGLPTEIGGGSGTTKVTFDLPSETTSSSTFTARRISSPDPRGIKGKNYEISNDSSFTSSRISGRSRASDMTDSFGDALSTGSERNTKLSSKYSSNEDSYNMAESKYKPNGGLSYSLKDNSDKYSGKSSLKSSRKFELEDDSFSGKPSESTSSFRSTRKVTTSTVDDAEECDADAFLSNIKKKFPTSDQILERIKKMDSEI